MPKNELELAEREPLAVARSSAEPLSIQQVFQAVLSSNISEGQLNVAKELLAMDAQRQFNIAFAALQKDMPVIVASSVIPNRGKYERFEDVMNQIGTVLATHGFSVSFSNEWKDNRITEACHLSHIGGHTRTNSFTVRVSGKADSETQADCKAATTAKRNALLNALNIIVRQDCLQDEDDPRNLGGFITPAQAEELERRVAETNSDRAAFLRVADADKFAEIPAGKYETLDAMLRRKENKGR